MVKERTWLEISKKALISNANQFRKLVKDKKILAVLKSNAYGHGLKEVAQILNPKIDWFGVDNLKEALVINELGLGKPILILGYTPLSWLPQIVNKNISLTVYNKETLKKIIALRPPKKVKIHLKIETGMNRQGVFIKNLLDFIKIIERNDKYLLLEGMSTHFSDIKRPPDFSYSKYQLGLFKKAIGILDRNNFEVPIFHCAATSATLLYPETYFDMVRVGIGLYGLWPSKQVRKNGVKIKLRPALSWKSVVAQVKEINKGEFVGYGRTWRAKRKTKIAVIPVGYYDGFDRGLSNLGRVLIKGKFAPVVGRVSMDMITVDISEIPHVRLEEEVVLIGKSGKKEITAEEVAEKTGTIGYEIIARINPLLSRFVL